MTVNNVHIFVCTNGENAEDKRHCGDKGGWAVWKAFREARKKYQRLNDVLVTKVGCTGQHGACGASEGVVIIYGHSLPSQGVWYRMTEGDVDEVFREHVMNGRVVERLVNRDIQVKWG